MSTIASTGAGVRQGPPPPDREPDGALVEISAYVPKEKAEPTLRALTWMLGLGYGDPMLTDADEKIARVMDDMAKRDFKFAIYGEKPERVRVWVRAFVPRSTDTSGQTASGQLATQESASRGAALAMEQVHRDAQIDVQLWPQWK
jgi:hypothetical protein